MSSTASSSNRRAAQRQRPQSARRSASPPSTRTRSGSRRSGRSTRTRSSSRGSALSRAPSDPEEADSDAPNDSRQRNQYPHAGMFPPPTFIRLFLKHPLVKYVQRLLGKHLPTITIWGKASLSFSKSCKHRRSGIMTSMASGMYSFFGKTMRG